ncbi:MAG: Sir2 family NAD-dependent protein deacetylase [Acidimicrobiales bacterium]
MKPASELTSEIAAAAELVAASDDVVVLTGAGISTDSGIPDFRGPDGIWTKDPDAEKASNIEFYVSDADLRKRNWQRHVEGSPYLGRDPNPGHHALVDLESQGRLHTLITQNVDGLHLAAGTSPQRLVEIHGNARNVKCLDCGDGAPLQVAIDRVAQGEVDPPCRSCGGILKTATVSFGQSLDNDDLLRSQQAAGEADLLLAVGSTLTVYPVAEVVPMAHRRGVPVVIVNGSPTPFDAIATVVLRASISEVLPIVVAAGAAAGPS